jgi:hypothetical protein
MSLNNMTNTLNTRFRALVTDWREFVLMVRDVRREDAGQYECQVSPLTRQIAYPFRPARPQSDVILGRFVQSVNTVQFLSNFRCCQHHVHGLKIPNVFQKCQVQSDLYSYTTVTSVLSILYDD